MQRQNNSGRSMVEMLGVLAIAGVITIGGLAGFQAAMQKMRANDITEIIALVSTYALTHNVNITKDKINTAIEGSLPDCIDDIKADTEGFVEVTFKEDCDKIKSLVGTSFASCRWTLEGNTGTYNPQAQREGGKCVY